MKPSLFLMLFFFLSACGGNPVKVAKERDQADERRRTTEKENAELEAKNEQLETALKYVFTTTNNVWTFAAITTEYEAAVNACETVGFLLPTTGELAEFKTEVYDREVSWKKYSFERFYRKDVNQNQGEQFGFVLCRRQLKRDIART